ncbi:MAG: hypothetical protein GY941_27160 [Planctomycetes bacterium]|nr:hypothetical protein [Planctomycetota bacterium]
MTEPTKDSGVLAKIKANTELLQSQSQLQGIIDGIQIAVRLIYPDQTFHKQQHMTGKLLERWRQEKGAK